MFYFITYYTNNTEELCVFVIYQHRGKCNLLITILLLLCSSRRLPLEPQVIDCLHILNTFGVLTTDKQRIFMIVVLFIHRLCQQYGKKLLLIHLPTQRLVKFIDNNNTVNIMISYMSLILIHMSYFSSIIILFLPFAQLLTTCCFKKLIYCRFIWPSVVIFQVKNTTYQKVSGISWK